MALDGADPHTTTRNDGLGDVAEVESLLGLRVSDQMRNLF